MRECSVASATFLHQGFFVPGLNATRGFSPMFSLGAGCRGTTARSQHGWPLRCTSKRTKWRMAMGPSVPKRGPRCARIRSANRAFHAGLATVHPARGQGRRSQKSIQLAGEWIADFRPRTNYDLAWRLQGLVWGRKSNDAIPRGPARPAGGATLDGGWPRHRFDGKRRVYYRLAMMALASSGLPVSDPLTNGAFSTC